MFVELIQIYFEIFMFRRTEKENLSLTAVDHKINIKCQCKKKRIKINRKNRNMNDVKKNNSDINID